MYMLGDNEQHVFEHYSTDDELEAFDKLHEVSNTAYVSNEPITFWIEENIGWQIVEGSVRLRGNGEII